MGKDLKRLRNHRYFRVFQHGGWNRLEREEIAPSFRPEVVCVVGFLVLCGAPAGLWAACCTLPCLYLVVA